MTLSEVIDFEIFGNDDVSHAMRINADTIFVTFKDATAGVLAVDTNLERGWQWVGPSLETMALQCSQEFNA